MATSKLLLFRWTTPPPTPEQVTTEAQETAHRKKTWEVGINSLGRKSQCNGWGEEWGIREVQMIKVFYDQMYEILEHVKNDKKMN